MRKNLTDIEEPRGEDASDPKCSFSAPDKNLPTVINKLTASLSCQKICILETHRGTFKAVA